MKQNETKKAVILIIIMGLCTGAGFVFGKLMKGFDFKAMLEQIPMYHTGLILSVIYMLFAGGLLIWAGIIYSRTKKLADAWDGENEAQIDLIEKQLNMPVFLSNTVLITGLCLYSCCCYFLAADPGRGKWLLLADSILFLLSLAVIFVIQKKTVDAEIQLNPEKQVSLLDMHFTRNLLSACDEAELSMIHEAGFKAFQAGSITCYVLWLMAFIMQLAFKCGVLPVIFICIIWMVMNVTYMKMAEKLEFKS